MPNNDQQLYGLQAYIPQFMNRDNSQSTMEILVGIARGFNYCSKANSDVNCGWIRGFRR